MTMHRQARLFRTFLIGYPADLREAAHQKVTRRPQGEKEPFR
jgi:hypothetical protein